MLALSRSPLRQDEAAGAAEPAPRLLIVDDIADNRTILARRFVKRGFLIVEADCGVEALRRIESELFDVVLLDVMMPGMDGMEVLRRVRAQRSAAELPVVMVTANALSEDVASALEIGANDYVTKPVDFPVALARVRKQVAARRTELAARGARDSLRQENTGLTSRIAESRARLEQANAVVQAEVRRRLQSEDRIAYLAHHDVLTGLANRFAFEQSVGRALAAGSAGVSLLFIDLDGFKSVNDTLGHAAGDEVLRGSAATNSRCFMSRARRATAPRHWPKASSAPSPAAMRSPAIRSISAPASASR
jgi:PleD family two-component response regulator